MPNTCFLFSPSSSYPEPFACLIDADGNLVHAWGHPAHQPEPAGEPPTYLMGWNHVEIDDDGNFYATVPLRSLLKLGPNSELIWKADVSAHHDLDIDAHGNVYVLTEEPRLVEKQERVVLDNTVTVLASDGRLMNSYSLYDILSSDPTLASLIAEKHDLLYAAAAAATEAAAGLKDGCGPYDEKIRAMPAAEMPEFACDPDRKRDLLRYFRGLPGSPSDILHANTVEVLGADQPGRVLVSLRSLDVIAVLDLAARGVTWWWGPGVLSGQHQPSALPNGNVLVFDNGRTAGRSRVVEVEPATGSIVWEHVGDPPDTFFCDVAGGCELLANGNVLVTDSRLGRIRQVTRGGDIAWELEIVRTKDVRATSRVALYRMSAVPRRALAKGGFGYRTAANRLVEKAGLQFRVREAGRS